MFSLPFFIVDVFAEKQFTGNQLAVVLNANALTDEEMQQIAREMNFSETAFVRSDSPSMGGYPVRIFTPQQEIPFAGHPTLGTAFVINNEYENGSAKQISLDLQAGSIPVEFQRNFDTIECLWMKPKKPSFGTTLEIEQLAEALNLQANDFDPEFPIQEVSTGLPFLIIPVKSLDALKRATVAKDLYWDLVNTIEAKGLYLFCPETYDPSNQFCVRMFADAYGISEDPATGSGGGCFAAYLVKYNYLSTDSIDFKVEQGMEIGRPSLLYLRANKENDEISVKVGGKVIDIIHGRLV